MKREKISIELDGDTHRVTPDFITLDAVESAGIRPLALMRDMQAGNVGVTHLARMIHAALSASDDEFLMTYRQVGQSLMDEEGGLRKATAFCSDFINAALSPAPDKPVKSSGDGEGKATASA